MYRRCERFLFSRLINTKFKNTTIDWLYSIQFISSLLFAFFFFISLRVERRASTLSTQSTAFFIFYDQWSQFISYFISMISWCLETDSIVLFVISLRWCSWLCVVVCRCHHQPTDGKHTKSNRSLNDMSWIKFRGERKMWKIRLENIIKYVVLRRQHGKANWNGIWSFFFSIFLVPPLSLSIRHILGVYSFQKRCCSDSINLLWVFVLRFVDRRRQTVN